MDKRKVRIVQEYLDRLLNGKPLDDAGLNHDDDSLLEIADRIQQDFPWAAGKLRDMHATAKAVQTLIGGA